MNIELLRKDTIRDYMECLPYKQQQELIDRLFALAESDKGRGADHFYGVAWLANDICMQIKYGEKHPQGNVRAYMAIESESAWELGYKLDQLTRAGWQPQGGVSITVLSEADWGGPGRIYCQAVTHRHPHGEQHNPEAKGYSCSTSVPCMSGRRQEPSTS